MMNKIHRIYKAGPFGDETSLYDVIFPEGMTVAEFIETIVEENPKEWGDFLHGFHNPIIAEYQRGKIVYKPEFEKVKNKVVEKAEANGGWSLMSYDLSFKGGLHDDLYR